MRALDLVIEGPSRLRMADEIAPERPRQPGDVLVEVDCVTLCGSDYGLFHGTYGGPSQYPLRFGHEWSGRVLDAGPAAAHLIGQVVTGDCSRWCGRCDQCAVDRNRCRHIEKFGLTVDGFSVRERVVHQRYLYPNTHRLDPSTLALTEMFAVVHRGLRRIPGLIHGGEVLVVGGGALGAAAALLLTRQFAVSRVALREPAEAKRDLLGTLLGGRVEIAPPATGLADVHGYRAVARQARYPVVVECSGTPEGMLASLVLAAFGGTVLWLGLPRTAVGRPELVVTKGLSVVGSIGGTGDFPAAMRFLARHEAAVATMLTDRFPADRAVEALSPSAPERAGRIKAQLDFRLPGTPGDAPPRPGERR